MSERPWVVFDLGEVLSVAPPHLSLLAATAGVEVDAFSAAYWAHRDAYDAGGSPAAYWTAVLGADAAGPSTVRELTDIDVSAWIELHPDSLALLEDVARSTAHLGLLSNAPEPLALAVRAQPWAAVFDAMLFSADLGLTKPDRRIFDAATALMAPRAGLVVFFDDRAVNVVGANAAGWRGHLWQGHADARAVLAADGVL